MLKYEAIAQDIQSHIEDGALAPNDKLPTVVDLCERYGVSKITVKRAFEILTERGLKRDQLYHSVYSFVQDTLGLKISSFHRIIRAVGATEEEAGRLRLDAGTPLLEISQVGFLDDGTPFEFSVARSNGMRSELRDVNVI